ncbi:MAG: hypothetical protein L0154_24740 [Chloroflexi bacterium]|nr:hypothetical protein [Chloroflexota bacterium]
MSDRRQFDLTLSILIVLFLVVMLWSMIGLNRTIALFEGWSAINLIVSDDPAVPAPEQWATRPLHWAIYVFAYELDTSSMFGFNLTLIVLNALRGLLTLAVLRQLFPDSKFIPLAVTVLFIVYPIGNGYFNFRALPIQLALNLGLVAVWCLLLYWKEPRRWLWVVILSAQIVSLLTYELLYAVFGLVPVLMWWLERRVFFDRRFVRVSALWYSLYALASARLLYLLARGTGGYVSGRVDERLSDKSIPSLIVDITAQLYADHIRFWWIAAKFLDESVRVTGTALLVALFVVAASWYLLQRDEQRLSWTSLGVLVAGGIVFMFVAYLHNLPIAERASGFRVFFSATLGAAFVIAVILYGIRQRAPFGLAIALVGIFATTFIGTADTMLQNHYYAELSMERQRVLAKIIETVPHPDPDTTLLVIDEGLLFKGSEQPNPRSSHLNEALEFIYGYRVDVHMCALVPRNETCTFSEDSIQFESRVGEQSFEIAYDNVILFQTTETENVVFLEEIPERYIDADVPYNPEALIDRDAPYPANAKTFFTCFPLESCDNFPSLDFRQKYREYR